MAPLNDTEMKLLVTAFETAKTPLQPDYEAIAQRLGYKNRGIATTMWGRIKKKLNATGDASNPSTPAKKRGRGKDDGSEDGDDEQNSSTATPKRPRKSAKTPKSTTKKGKKPGDSAEEDELDSKSGIKAENDD